MSAELSCTVAGCKREHRRGGAWDPRKSLLCTIRDYQRYRRRSRGLALAQKRWAVLRHRFWSIVSGAGISRMSQMEGVLLQPYPNGLVIRSLARIRPNCLIGQQVTLGTHGDVWAPLLDGHVDVGAGTKWWGGIAVCEHTRSGANAVALMDVPPHSIATDVPAVVHEARR